MQHGRIFATRACKSSRAWHCLFPRIPHPRARPVSASVKPVSPEPRKAIVIVDDEQSYSDLLSQLLTEHLDCPVITFTRPLDALAALPMLDVGVVVTDYYMPKLNGLEFISQAEPLVPGTPFIIITGHTVGLPEEELEHLSALKGLLHKPFSWRKLADEILRVWPDGAAIPLLKADATSF
jgi:DNA-binding NtrC family response regulator